MAQKRVLTVARGDPEELLPLLVVRLGQDEEAVRSLLANGAVYLGKDRCREAIKRLFPGMRVMVYLPALEKRHESLQIVHQDEYLLVVDKPAGMLTQPALRTRCSLLSFFAEQGEEVHPLHRLDRDASGLVLLARTRDACAPLQRALERGAIRRRYLAVVEGRPQSKSELIDLRIARDVRDSRCRVALPSSAPAGLPALTRYRIEQALSGDRTLLSLDLLTGRTHQIRVHLSAVGHPIVGDTCYGGNPAPRLLLHATELSFPHPRTGVPCRYLSPPPAAFCH